MRDVAEIANDPAVRAAVLRSLTEAEEAAVESEIWRRRQVDDHHHHVAVARERQAQRQVAVEKHVDGHGKRWTQHELDVLRDPWLTSQECGRILGRTEQAVKTARRLYATGPAFNRKWINSRAGHPERQRALRAHADALAARPVAVERGPSATTEAGLAWRAGQLGLE